MHPVLGTNIRQSYNPPFNNSDAQFIGTHCMYQVAVVVVLRAVLVEFFVQLAHARVHRVVGVDGVAAGNAQPSRVCTLWRRTDRKVGRKAEAEAHGHAQTQAGSMFTAWKKGKLYPLRPIGCELRAHRSRSTVRPPPPPPPPSLAASRNRITHTLCVTHTHAHTHMHTRTHTHRGEQCVVDVGQYFGPDKPAAVSGSSLLPCRLEMSQDACPDLRVGNLVEYQLEARERAAMRVGA